MLAVGMRVPEKAVLISAGDPKDKASMLEPARLLQRSGYKIYATKGTSKFLTTYKVPNTRIYMDDEEGEPKALRLLHEKQIDLVVSVPKVIDTEHIDNGLLAFCREKGIGYIAFSPLAQGLLTDRYINGIPADSRMAKGKFLRAEQLTDEVRAKVAAVRVEAAERKITTAQRALGWILEQPGVTSVLVGASSVEQLQDNLAVVQ
jgi:hypothetical protein